MSSPESFIADQTEKYRFSEQDALSFLNQSTPREIPASLQFRVQTSPSLVATILCCSGGTIMVTLLLAPSFLPEHIGEWSTAFKVLGIVIGVAFSAASILVLRNPSKGLAPLLRDGEVVIGRFKAIDGPQLENLRSAASHTKVNELDRYSSVTIEFEAGSQVIHTNQILPYQYVLLARWYQQSGRDVLILYSSDDPQNARWVGELFFPCPELPPTELEPIQ